ncbi:MAG TPA: BatA domain-containing protein [Tepidisphaeraceae bacterium]|jgi:hypothetical protein|nr:BatA domain-containing protein [Tepidisphaeraceae bacterium]
MTLLHPLALAGLVAAATPVAIYLLLRRRKTEIQWGAGYLLRLALASKKRSSLWRQFIVLTVRSLILALAALLIAQPFRPGHNASSDTPALPDRAVHRVVLFDNSRSMTVADAGAGATRLERARRAAGALLLSDRPGDTLDFIPLIPRRGGVFDSVALDGKIDDNHAEHSLAAIPTRDGQIALEPALAAAMTRLALTPGSAGEIYLFSDFPRELETQIAALSWFAPLARERGVRVAPVSMIGPAGATSEQNVSIDSATLGTDLLVAGVSTRLYIDASNHSDRQAVAVFDVAASNIPLRRQTVRLNPDERKRIAIPLTLPAGAGQIISVAVTPTRLATQGTRSLVVDVKDALDVWLVADEKDPASPAMSGGTGDDAAPDDTEFFRRAVKLRKDQSPGIRLRSARMNELTLPIPANVDAIVLAGPRYTTPAIAKPLLDFVRRGGGLFITASPAIQLPAFNENLAALLPAPLDKPMREKIDPEIFLQAQVDPRPSTSGGVTEPLFEEFAAQGADGPQSDLPQARFYDHYRLHDMESLAGVVLRLSNGDPLLIEKHVGRGRVYFFASTLGVEWTSLPVRQSYIPLLTRIFSAAATGRVLPLNLQPGATFIAPWPVKGAVTLSLADQSTRTVDVLDAAAGQFIVLDDLRDAGLYRIADSTGHRGAFTIAGGGVENDLRSLPRSAKAQLAAALGADIFLDWTAAVKALGPAGATAPLWPWLLAAILVLYLFETWFVRTI